LVPSYHSEKLDKDIVAHGHYTRNFNNIEADRTSSTYGNNSISSKGVLLYNRLPYNTRILNSIQGFKRECLKSISDPNKWKPNNTDPKKFWCIPY
jgi:hypothetical protein